MEAKRAGAIGYTVRVVPHHPLLANAAEMGLATLPAGVPRAAGGLRSDALTA